MQAFDDLARGLIMSLAASLHLPADAFQPTLDNAELYCKQSASTLEAIHDMLPESQAVQLNTPEACREHKDKGVLNLTYSDTEQGLWVCFSRKVALQLLCCAYRKQVKAMGPCWNSPSDNLNMLLWHGAGTRAEWNLDPPAATRRSDCCSSRLHP